MKIKVMFFASFLFLLACGDSQNKQLTEEVIVDADASAFLTVEGMVCEAGCAAYIDKELESLDGVASVDVDLESKIASISFDNSLVSERKFVDVINTIKDSTYSVSNVEVKLIQKSKKVSIDTH
jgi:periplasmic mercuric ion binding protein